MPRALEQHTQARFGELFREIAALSPDLVQPRPGTFKVGRRTLLGFTEKGDDVVAKLALAGGHMEFCWGPEKQVTAQDREHLLGLLRSELGLAEAEPAGVRSHSDGDGGGDGAAGGEDPVAVLRMADPQRDLAAIFGAIATLQQRGDSASIAALLEGWRRATDAEVRKALLMAFGAMKAAAAAEHLVPAVDDPHPFVALHAVLALGEIGGTWADLVATKADHPVTNVRLGVARALGVLGRRDDVTTLARLLATPDAARRDRADAPASDVRKEAAVALGRIGGPSARAALEARLPEEPRKPVRSAIERAIAACSR